MNWSEALMHELCDYCEKNKISMLPWSLKFQTQQIYICSPSVESLTVTTSYIVQVYRGAGSVTEIIKHRPPTLAELIQAVATANAKERMQP